MKKSIYTIVSVNNIHAVLYKNDTILRQQLHRIKLIQPTANLVIYTLNHYSKIRSLASNSLNSFSLGNDKKIDQTKPFEISRELEN